MNPLDKMFYDLTVAQRDSAWREVEDLEGKNDALRDALHREHMARLGIGHALVECLCNEKPHVRRSAVTR